MKSVLRRASVATGAVAALILTACSSEQATVTEKSYIPGASTWVTKDRTVERCTGTGKKRRCKDVVVGQKRVRETSRECWRLTLRENDGDVRHDCVTPGVYHGVEVGDRR
jgi:hypothetical protein